MFASIISGALISLVLFYLAPLPLMVAALGWGPLSAAIGGIAAGVGARRCCSACPIAIAFASPSRCPPGGSAISRCSAGRSPMPRPPAMALRRPPPAIEWYPLGRMLLWVAGFAVPHHHGRAAHARHRCRRRSSATLKRGLLRIARLARREPRPTSSASIDAFVDDRAGGRRNRRHDDADTQSVARRQNHRDLGPAQSSLARHEDARRCRR